MLLIGFVSMAANSSGRDFVQTSSRVVFSILVLADIGGAPLYGMLIVEFYCRMRA